MPPATDRDALDALVEAYETLQPDSVTALAQRYAADARFKDPFNEVVGRPAIARIFSHMFEQLQRPRFIVTARFLNDGEAMLIWEFRFARGRATEMTIQGASHLRFDDQGLVTEHRDYWDAAEELYSKLPILGRLMGWLQRRLATPQP